MCVFVFLCSLATRLSELTFASGRFRRGSTVQVSALQQVSNALVTRREVTQPFRIFLFEKA
jgi:hypothetical protein